MHIHSILYQSCLDNFICSQVPVCNSYMMFRRHLVFCTAPHPQLLHSFHIFSCETCKECYGYLNWKWALYHLVSSAFGLLMCLCAKRKWNLIVSRFMCYWEIITEANEPLQKKSGIDTISFQVLLSHVCTGIKEKFDFLRLHRSIKSRTLVFTFVQH